MRRAYRAVEELSGVVHGHGVAGLRVRLIVSRTDGLNRDTHDFIRTMGLLVVDTAVEMDGAVRGEQKLNEESGALCARSCAEQQLQF